MIRMSGLPSTAPFYDARRADIRRVRKLTSHAPRKTLEALWCNSHHLRRLVLGCEDYETSERDDTG